MEINKEQQTTELEVKEVVQEDTKAKAAKPKKEKPPQISLTFKRNSPIELDLYEHLQNKFYQGAYIKELLINQMLKERPDLAEKYTFTAPLDPIDPQQQPKPIQENTATIDPITKDITLNDEVFTPTAAVEQQPKENAPEPSGSLNEGLMATLGEFL